MITYRNSTTGNIVAHMTPSEEADLAATEAAASKALRDSRGTDDEWLRVARLACAKFGLRMRRVTLGNRSPIAVLSSTYDNCDAVEDFFEDHGILTSSRSGKITRVMCR